MRKLQEGSKILLGGVAQQSSSRPSSQSKSNSQIVRYIFFDLPMHQEVGQKKGRYASSERLSSIRGDFCWQRFMPPTSELTLVSSKPPWLSCPVGAWPYSQGLFDALDLYHIEHDFSTGGRGGSGTI
jgi:hypothetical protein